MRGPVMKRLMARVDKEVVPSCWTWTGGGIANGYGTIRLNAESHGVVHRVAFEHFVGPIPDGLTLDHLCRNRRCVNPAHLQPVTSRTNTLRGRGPAAINIAKTHCKRGHEFTEENIYSAPGVSGRACRTCKKNNDRARYLARRAAA